MESSQDAMCQLTVSSILMKHENDIKKEDLFDIFLELASLELDNILILIRSILENMGKGSKRIAFRRKVSISFFESVEGE